MAAFSVLQHVVKPFNRSVFPTVLVKSISGKQRKLSGIFTCIALRFLFFFKKNSSTGFMIFIRSGEKLI